MKFLFVIIAFGVAAVLGNPTGVSLDKSDEDVERAIPIKILSKCSLKDGSTGLISCAAEKSLELIQQAINKDTIEILPGVDLVSEQPLNHQRQAKSISDDRLPSDPKQKIEKLLDLLFDAAHQVFSGRTLKIKIPEVSTNGVARALEEGRKKMKKGLSPLLIGLGIKAILFKGLLLVGLKFMAVKAAILSKIAFALALVLASQTLFAGGLSGLSGLNFKKNIPFLGGQGSGVGHGSYGPPGWSTGSVGGWNQQYPYARSIDEVNEKENSYKAQDLAYSDQKP